MTKSRALARVGVLAAIAWTISSGAVLADASSAYDQAVKDSRNVPITFGHYVDLQGAVMDFAKTLVDKVKLPNDSADKVKAGLLNAHDFWKDTQESVAAGEGMSESALTVFVVKTMLDNLSPKEVVRMKEVLRLNANLSNKMAKTITKKATEYGVGGVESGSQAAGEGWEGDSGAAQTLVLGIVDTVCPECAVARKGVLLTYEAAKAVQAWVEDETTKVQYGNWKAWEKGGATEEATFLTTPGFAPTLKAAKTALEAIYAGQRPPRTTAATPDEVTAFVRHKFQSWKRAEDKQNERADLLVQAKDDYLNLCVSERIAFGGSTEQEQLRSSEEDRARGFVKGFSATYDELMRQKGERPMPPGGKDRLLEDAVRLAGIRAKDGDSAYYGALLDQMKGYGWAAVVPKSRMETIKGRLTGRLSHLSYNNLKTFFDYAGLNETGAFYECLCNSAWGNLVKHYDPGPGGPCFFGGLGQWHGPFPSDRDSWKYCLAHTKVGDQSFADHIAERIIQWKTVK